MPTSSVILARGLPPDGGTSICARIPVNDEIDTIESNNFFFINSILK